MTRATPARSAYSATDTSSRSPDSSHILEKLAPKNAKHDPGKPQAA